MSNNIFRKVYLTKPLLPTEKAELDSYSQENNGDALYNKIKSSYLLVTSPHPQLKKIFDTEADNLNLNYCHIPAPKSAALAPCSLAVGKHNASVVVSTISLIPDLVATDHVICSLSFLPKLDGNSSLTAGCMMTTAFDKQPVDMSELFLQMSVFVLNVQTLGSEHYTEQFLITTIDNTLTWGQIKTEINKFICESQRVKTFLNDSLKRIGRDYNISHIKPVSKPSGLARLDPSIAVDLIGEFNDSSPSKHKKKPRRL